MSLLVSFQSRIDVVCQRGVVVPKEDQFQLVSEIEFGAVVEALKHRLEDKGQSRRGAEVVLSPVGGT